MRVLDQGDFRHRSVHPVIFALLLVFSGFSAVKRTGAERIGELTPRANVVRAGWNRGTRLAVEPAREYRRNRGASDKQLKAWRTSSGAGHGALCSRKGAEVSPPRGRGSAFMTLRRACHGEKARFRQ